MKHLLAILLLATLCAFSGHGQTIKTLSHINGQIVANTGTNTLTLTNLSGVVLQNGPLAVSEIQDNSGNSIFMVNDRYFVNVSANSGVALDWGGSSVIVGLPISFAASSNAATTRTNLGLGATNSVTFSNLTLNGTLTAASIATSTPVSWSLDAVQTAAATNGVLDLPLNANVLRITNANTISAITNGRLGAFYYIVNQSGTNLVLSNSATLTTRGGGTVTLAPNQSATLLSTSATNATLQGGPSQLDSPTFAGLTTSGTLTATGNVTMSGTANTAPNQTAASGSSIMTRDLGDARYSFSRWFTGYELLGLDNTTGALKTFSSGNANGGVFDNQMVNVTDANNAKFNLPIDWRVGGQIKIVSYWTDRVATNTDGTNADVAVWSQPFTRTPTNNAALPGSVSGTQVQNVFTANYGGTARVYVVEQTLDFSTVSGISATNPLQVKFVELQRRALDATDTSTNNIWLSGVHIYVP